MHNNKITVIENNVSKEIMLGCVMDNNYNVHAYYHGRYYKVRFRDNGKNEIIVRAKKPTKMKIKKDKGTKEVYNPYVDDVYVSYIKDIPCLVCSRSSDPHHLKARGWREVKRNDYTCVPLCRIHHTEIETIGMSKFEEGYAISMWQEASRLAIEYLVTKLRKSEGIKHEL